MKKGILMALTSLTGFITGAGIVGQRMGKEIEKNHDKSDKHLALYLMMNQWVKVKQDGKNLAEYFEANGFKNIAIYGMNYVGETLFDELKNTDIKVAYGIDKNADQIYSPIDIYNDEEKLKEVDAVVVTAITYFDEIERTLAGKLNCPIISLENVLYEV